MDFKDLKWETLYQKQSNYSYKNSDSDKKSKKLSPKLSPKRIKTYSSNSKEHHTTVDAKEYHKTVDAKEHDKTVVDTKERDKTVDTKERDKTVVDTKERDKTVDTKKHDKTVVDTKERDKTVDTKKRDKTVDTKERDLNEKILIQDKKKTGRIDKDRKNKKHKLSWESLGNNYIKLLSNSNFVIKNVLADGNCQFRAIEEALKNTNNMTFNHKQLRSIIGERITALSDENFKQILENYRLEKTSGDFVGGWDPFSITKRNQLANQVKKTGFHFQGDYITLSLLAKILNITFIILQDNYSFYFIKDEIHDTNKRSKIIILFYNKTEHHYKLVGFKNNNDDSSDKIKTIFYNDDPEINTLLNKNEFYKSQIESIKHEKEKLTLNEIYKQLETRVSNKLSKQDRHIISKLKLI
jgi:predicted lactoylglutathione lyase